jgi:hypothetical protein
MSANLPSLFDEAVGNGLTKIFEVALRYLNLTRLCAEVLSFRKPCSIHAAPDSITYGRHYSNDLIFRQFDQLSE